MACVKFNSCTAEIFVRVHLLPVHVNAGASLLK